MKPAQVPINQWVDKENVVCIYTHHEILLSHKKEQNNDIHKNLDGIGDYYSKWSNSGIENQTFYVLNGMWDLKYKDTKAYKNDTRTLGT